MLETGNGFGREGLQLTKDQTKRQVSKELEAMLTQMPLAKVRVGDLCERCQISRQTFYYHFRDKYDVVAWIFERDYRLGAASTGGHEDAVAAVGAYARMWEHRDFYRVAFADKSQNSISVYIHDFDVRLMTRVALRHLGISELTPRQLFDIKHHSYGAIGCVVEWLRGEIEATPEQFAAWESASIPEFLREAYRVES